MSDFICGKIADMIMKSKMTVSLTGAGISTESGIPDFRSHGTGLWEKIDPMEALSSYVLYKNPHKFYSTGFKILTSMKNAKPNKAHEVLAVLERERLMDCVITQNIDNLHYMAGSKNILEVHGHIRTGHCMSCGKLFSLEDIETKLKFGKVPPECECGGTIRTDVVLFGDSMPECFNEAWEKSRNCELMIVIGSSLQVGPVNQLPALAGKLIIINAEDTPYDTRADVVCRERASIALNRIYEEIQEIKRNGRV